MAKKFLKNLKSLFVVEEEVTPPPPPPRPKRQAPQKSRPQSRPPQSETNRIVRSEEPAFVPPEPRPIPTPKPKPQPKKVKLNEAHVQLLLKAMEDNNLEGLDYLEFKESLEALSKMPMDEETKYKSAYAVASSMGANVHKLIQAAIHYLDIIKKEKEGFHLNTMKKMNDEMKSKKNGVLKLEKSISTKKKQIAKLKKEIDQVERDMIDKISEAQQFDSKVKATEIEFETAYKVIKGNIDKDIKKMREYLTVKATKDPFDDSLDLDFDVSE
ncbi:MAG: hypothetical protein AAF587_08165 [Bacteroidota bacterium]